MKRTALVPTTDCWHCRYCDYRFLPAGETYWCIHPSINKREVQRSDIPEWCPYVEKSDAEHR